MRSQKSYQQISRTFLLKSLKSLKFSLLPPLPLTSFQHLRKLSPRPPILLNPSLPLLPIKPSPREAVRMKSPANLNLFLKLLSTKYLLLTNNTGIQLVRETFMVAICGPESFQVSMACQVALNAPLRTASDLGLKTKWLRLILSREKLKRKDYSPSRWKKPPKLHTTPSTFCSLMTSTVISVTHSTTSATTALRKTLLAQ